ncbi:PREDICTED: monocarboxylate transporter 13-like isoform X1 [Branchiostoma belcheri]|uniref:Monocarboxylate transporter 13-like isoform X1 n=1 Tax=Branchiostoma belcheri TaxID=7741 RepID=A0A6P4YLI5_BRABE|nr:PREDICTED: monocarboxylate transporter 13-like isoform X1 [Branchiostoma belcheri]
MANPESRSQPPDGGWGWMVVLAGFIVSGCTIGTYRSLGVFFLTFSQQFQASSAETAWITSILIFVTAFLSPVGTALASTIGFRPTIMLGGVLTAAGYIVSGFATRMFHLYLGIGCLTGLGYALSLSPAVAIVGQYFTRRRAMATSLLMLGSSVASMAFPPLFQYLMDEYGWKGALLIIGGIMLNIVVAGALIRPLEAYRDRKVENSLGNSRVNESDMELETGNGKKCFTDAANFLKEFWAQMNFKVILIPSVALFLASLFIKEFVINVPGLYIIPRAKQLQIEDYAAASLLTVSSIADMVSRLAVGAIPDNSRFSRFDQYGLSLCLLGVSNLLFPLAKTYPALVAYAIANGAFYGAFLPMTATCVADLVGPERLPSALGILASIQGFASLAGPPFAGWLFDETQSYDATFLQAGAGFLLAGLLPFLLRLRKKRPADTTEEPADSPQTVRGNFENETLLVPERETTV